MRQHDIRLRPTQRPSRPRPSPDSATVPIDRVAAARECPGRLLARGESASSADGHHGQRITPRRDSGEVM
jgi:hypothetical protein